MQTTLKLPPFEQFLPYAFDGARFLLILGLAYLATKLVERLVRAVRRHSVRIMEKRAGSSGFELEKRARTIGAITRKTLVAIIWTASLLMALGEIGFDVRPLLAGAGIIGLAIGFGAQNLVKDLLNGLFLLVENQIRVGDVAVINGASGLVEEMNLRTTLLRSENGAVHIFPNGSIQTLSNLTREFSYYVFDIPVPYQEDTDAALAAIEHAAAGLAADDGFRTLMVAPIEILGVDRFAEAGAVIKARLKTPPAKQWIVGREMNRRIKKEFEAREIALPFPSMRLLIETDELKSVIREVLREPRG